MKITVRNLGPIKNAEIELKPLTIFIGPNNTGKTWMAYLISGIFGGYGLQHYAQDYVDGKVQQEYPPLEVATQQVWEAGNAKIDVVKFAEDYAEVYFNDVALRFKQWLPHYMASERISSDSLEVSVHLMDTKADLLKRVASFGLDGSIGTPPGSQAPPLLKATKDSNEPFAYFVTQGPISQDLPSRLVKQFVAQMIFQVIHACLFRRTYPFPTERAAHVSLPYREEWIERVASFNSVVNSFSGINAPRVMMPISHFIDMMRSAFATEIAQPRLEKLPAKKEYARFAQLLEKEVLGGNVAFSTPEPGPTRELLFQPSKTTSLEMPIASSMVKELSPLVLYLRHVAWSNELLVIDEPEMNLHPEAQAQLTEFMAMLANAELNLLVTTHSPYIVDHLENLIVAAQHKDKEAIKGKFYLKRTESFISKENVAIYLFKDGKAKNIFGSAGHIDWQTFAQVSDKVSKIYFDIAEARDVA